MFLVSVNYGDNIVNNVEDLLIDIKAVLVAIVCGCVISGVYSVINGVVLLFLPLLLLLSVVLLCSLLIL